MKDPESFPDDREMLWEEILFKNILLAHVIQCLWGLESLEL